jgi:hypothetical protein
MIMELLTLTSPALWPFSLALIILLGLIILEVIGLLLAASPFHGLDHVLPDVPDGALEWLHVGKVPILVLMLLFLLGFSLTGFIIQFIGMYWSTQFFPASIVILPALIGGLALVRTLGLMIGHLIPQDQTFAISDLALIGRLATISGGVAQVGCPAQARVRDQHGRLHYIQVEPEQGELPLGTEVILTDKIGVCYRARLLLPHSPSSSPTTHNTVK